nr:hypothetical protein [Tanacetum cinerariifolium]
EEEDVPEGQQRAVFVVETTVSEPLGLGYSPLRRRELALEEDHVYMFVDLESSTQADRAQSSRVLVPLPKDPFEAIRHDYLVGTDTESEPFEDEARTPESPHIVAPPTCHVEESESSGMAGVRSTSSDSTTPLSPDHPLTHTTTVLVPILRRTARMVVHVPPVMSPGLSAGMAEVATMSDSAFRKRFRSSYDSSPLPTLPVSKRYRGTSELILGIDSEEDEETPLSPEWTSGSLPISPLPYVVPSPVLAPMIPLIVPSPIASPMATSTATISVDEDQFIEIDRDARELYTRSGAVRDEIFSQRYRFRSLEQEEERTYVTFRALEARTTLQQELQEMRDRVTVLEQERDRKEW